MTQNLKFKSVRVTKVAFTAIASILSIALVYAQELQNPKKHNTKVYDVSFSPDGKLLASGSGDGTVKLWDVAIGKELNTLKGHSGRIYSVSFSPDGKTIASASADKTIKLWSLDGSLTKVLRGHDAEVTNVSFCPDNQVIVSSSVDNTISLWRSDGKLVKTLTVGGSIRNVDWGSVTEAVTRGKVACKYYETKISAFMMIWDSDCSSLLKSSDLDWSRNYGAKIMCLSSFFIH
ncbi:MAG: hypothetical protein V7L00_09300 [Nostoc sp.]|uniref:WD40 repeat domain-containing protein n=1 Tax=Nostoc sp. TaxID=1180 RepID=UPI002FFB3427